MKNVANPLEMSNSAIKKTLNILFFHVRNVPGQYIYRILLFRSLETPFDTRLNASSNVYIVVYFSTTRHDVISDKGTVYI